MTSANANVTVNTIIDRAFENAMAGMQRSMQQTITSINGFNRSQRAANSSGGAISRTLNQITKEGRGLSASFSRAKADMAGLDAAFRKNRATIAQLESSIKQLESANRRHGLSTKTGFDTGPLKAYKSQLESVNAMQKELTNTQRAMNFNELGKKFNKSAQTLSYAGMRMTYGLSLPISMFLRTGFQSLKALDKEVIRTGKLISDGFSSGAAGVKAYNAAMAELDTRLDKLSISWGVSRELVQGLAGDFAEIGISDPKALANLAQFTAEFEKLGNVDITQAQAAIQAIYQQIARVRRDQGLAVTGTKAINQMIEEVRGAIAFFNFAENKTTLSLKDMADAFPEVSAAATSFGLNMQTTAALLAPMVGAGFQVGASANSIKVSLQRLIAPTKKNQDIIKALTNVLGKDFRLSTKVGAEGIQDLIDGYTKLQDKLGDAGALTFFAELFGVRQGPRMEVAIKQMSEYQQSLDKVGSAERQLVKDLEKEINIQLRRDAQRGRTAEGQQAELVQLNKIKDIQDVIGQSQEKNKDGTFTGRALAIQKAQENEVQRLKSQNSLIDKGNSLLGERFDRISTESGKILSGAVFGTALTKETLEAELERVQGSLQVRYGRARESIKSIARELTVVFGDLLAAINPILEKISAWIQLLPSGTKKLIGVVLILLAALGPVLRTLGAVAQIAGSFSTMRSKGILKFKDDMVSLNGTIVESSSLLTRLGGDFRKVGKDGNIFVSKKNLRRLEKATPIQDKIDRIAETNKKIANAKTPEEAKELLKNREKLSSAEKSLYRKSIVGLIGKKEARRTFQGGGVLDNPVLPAASANLSGLDPRSIIAAQNLQNPAKVIEQYTIDLIKQINEAVIKATQRASKKTSSLNPRVGVNSLIANNLQQGIVPATPSLLALGTRVFASQPTSLPQSPFTPQTTTATPGAKSSTVQGKPVSAQYYTKLMAILQAIQKCICSPGRVVNTGTGTRPGQPSQPNAPPAQQTTTSRPAQPTTTQPAPQPTGGGQNASSGRRGRLNPVTPVVPTPTLGQFLKPTGLLPGFVPKPAATQATSSQNQVAQQASNDVKQAENVAKQTETKVSEAKKTAVSVSKKIELTKQSFIELLTNLGLEIPSAVAQMRDFAVSIQKRTFETLKGSLSGAGAQERLNAFAGGQKTALNIRSATYLNPLFGALGQTTARQATADAKYEKEMIEGRAAEPGLAPREMSAVEGKMHVRIVTGLRKKLEYYEGLQKKLDLEVQQVIQKVIASMPNASELAVNAAIKAKLAPLKERMDRAAEDVSLVRRQIKTAFEQITRPFQTVIDPTTGENIKQQLAPYTEKSKNKLLSILGGGRKSRSALPMAQRVYGGAQEELGVYPKTPTVQTGPAKSPYDADLPVLATSAQLAPVVIPEDKLTETINKLIRRRRIELLQQLGKVKKPEALGKDTTTIDKNIEQKIASLNVEQRATYDRLIKPAMAAARPAAVKILESQVTKRVSEIAAQIGKLEAENTKKIASLNKLAGKQEKEQEKERELFETIKQGKATLLRLARKVTHTADDVRLKEKTIVAKDEATEARAKLKTTISEREEQIASLEREIRRIDELINLGRQQLSEAQMAIKVVGEAPTPKPIKPSVGGGYPMPAAATRPIPERKNIDFFAVKNPKDYGVSGGATPGAASENLKYRIGQMLGMGDEAINAFTKTLSAQPEQIQAIAKKLVTDAQEELVRLKQSLSAIGLTIEEAIAQPANALKRLQDAKFQTKGSIEALFQKLVMFKRDFENLGSEGAVAATLKRFGGRRSEEQKVTTGTQSGLIGAGLPRGTDTGKEAGTKKGLAKQVADQIRATKTAENNFLEYEKKTLEYLAQEFGIKGASKLKQTELVAKLKEVLTKLEIVVQDKINQAASTVTQTTQAASQTTPVVPKLPRAPKPAATTPQGPPPEKYVPSSAIPRPLELLAANPVLKSPRQLAAEAKLAAAQAGTMGTTPIASALLDISNISRLKIQLTNFVQSITSAKVAVTNFATAAKNTATNVISPVFALLKKSAIGLIKRIDAPPGTANARFGNVERKIIDGFITPFKSGFKKVFDSVKTSTSTFMQSPIVGSRNILNPRGSGVPLFGGAPVGDLIKNFLKRGAVGLATAGYSEIFRGGRGVVRAAKETPQYMYAKEKVKEKVPQFIQAFKDYGKSIKAEFEPSINAFKNETVPAFKNGFAKVRKALREPFEASIQAFKTETIPAYKAGISKINAAFGKLGLIIKNSAAGQAFINEAIPAYRAAAAKISAASKVVGSSISLAGQFAVNVGIQAGRVAKKTFTKENFNKAFRFTKAATALAIGYAYNIEKEIIRLPITSTIIMAKGLKKAGNIVGMVWSKFKTTDFAQNTAIGKMLVSTASAINSGIKQLGSAVQSAAGVAKKAAVASGEFAKNVATLNFDKAASQLGRGIKTLGIGVGNVAGKVANAAFEGAKKIGQAAKKLTISIGSMALNAAESAAKAVTKPIFGVTQALFGVGGGPRTVQNQDGTTTRKMGFFRRDVTTDSSGQVVGKGPGAIRKTMGGVKAAFGGALSMGGQMANMLTYQLGPAGMLLAGPMNKVIGLMQRFSKVSAPILIIVGAIAVAIMVLKKTFENMGGKAQNIMDNFKAAFENIKAIFGVLVGVFKDFFASLFGSGAKDAKDGGENIRQVVGSISEKVLAFTEKFKAFFEKTLEPVIRRVLSGVSLAIKGIVGFIGPVIQFIRNLVGYFKGGGEESKKGMAKAFDGMKEAAKKVFIGLITIFKTPFIFLVNIVFKALGLVANIFERAMDVILIVISNLVRFAINAFFSIPKGILQIVEGIIAIWTNLQKAMVDIVKESIKLVIRGLFTLPQGAISLVGKLVGIFGGLITGWGKILQTMAKMFVEFGKKILVDLPGKIPVFGKVFKALGIDSIVSGAIDLLSKPLDAIGGMYENVGSTINKIVNSATSTLNNGLSSAEGKALGFVDNVGNGIKSVLSYIRDISDVPRNTIANAQNALLSGVLSAEKKSRAFIGSLSDVVVGLGDDIESWLKGLGEAETIAKGIGEDVGGPENQDAQTPSQAEAAGKTIAEAINEGMKNLKQNFFDKVIDNLSKALDRFKDKFKEALEKQKDEALKFFDDQIAAIDALAEAEERLTATKEYEENRRLKLSERALQRESYVKQRALAIYEGRIDDARLLNLQEEKDKRDFDKDLQKFDQDRTKTLQSQNREQAKTVIQEQKNALAEKFDKDIKSFEDFIAKVGEYGTLTEEQLTTQFNELQTKAITTSDAMRTAFQDYYGSLPGLIQQNTEPTVGFFGTSLAALITEATNKYGLTTGTKNPSSLLGVTESMLAGMSDVYTTGFTNTVLPSYNAGTTALVKIGTDFADPNNVNSPKQTYSRAIAEANAAVVAEFNKMNTSASSAFAEVITGINAETKKLAIAAAIRQAKEELEKAPQTVSSAINKAMSTPSAARSTVDQATAGVLFGDIWSQPMTDASGKPTGMTLGQYYMQSMQGRYYGGMVKRYNGGKIPAYATGGVVPGFAQQGVPALLHGGEYVINSKAVSGLGQMFLNYINEFKFGIPRYATPKIAMPEMGGQFKTEVIKTENETIHNYNFYVDNFIGEDQWFDSMMKNYNVKVLPNRQKAAGLESRVVRTYNGINRGM